MPASLTIGLVGHVLGAGAFLLLVIPLARHWRGRLQGSLLLAACLFSGVWMAVAACHAWMGQPPALLVALFEVIRSLGWIAFLAAMIWSGPVGWKSPSRKLYILLTGVLCLFVVGGLLNVRPDALALDIITPGLIVGLCLSIMGILLTEMLLRSTRDGNLWYSKFLCFATGVIFAYDLFIYAEAILFRGIDTTLLEARGYVQAMAVPMLAIAAVRNKMWRTNLSLSRDVVLRSTTLMATGVYLFLMAVAGYFLRDLDSAKGPVLQAVFLVGAAMVLVVVLFSGSSRAHLKVLVSKHFFKGKYDWRVEWLRFMSTLAVGRTAASLEQRAIKGIADIVESPGGAMWLLEGDRYEFSAEWNLTLAPIFSLSTEDPLAQFLSSTEWVIDIESIRNDEGIYKGPDLPKAVLDHERSWLIVPLYHKFLTGLILLVRPRAPISLGWEDFDLLKTVGRQTASYLAEQQALRALNEAREFEIFNRRFAFVVHDIKNLISQLSILCRNFDKHGDNEDFRGELRNSLHEAEDKMKRLMARIDSVQGESLERKGVAIAPLIQDVMDAKRGDTAALNFVGADKQMMVAGDRERLEALIAHLIQNAIEAIDGEGKVAVELLRADGCAVVEITDNGRGMDESFLRHELFKPFRTTKGGGMGLGAYQCRQYARELGGSLDVRSRLGEGTTMRVSLPLLTPKDETVVDLAAGRLR